MNKELTPGLRIVVYDTALKSYISENKNRNRGRFVDGMCKHMIEACRVNNINCTNTDERLLTRKNFPEYFSFKPKTGWALSTGYWLTRHAPTGYERRVKILTALSKGQTKEPKK